MTKPLGLILCFIAGALAVYFGNLGALAAVIIGQIGIVLSKQQLS